MSRHSELFSFMKHMPMNFVVDFIMTSPKYDISDKLTWN